MVFSSLFFLYVFLPGCLLLYFLAQSTEAKNWILLVFSLLFYAWGEPFWILQLLLSGTLVWLFGLALAKAEHDPRERRLYLILGCLAALLPLFVFKYADFLLGNLNVLLGLNIPLPNFSLPIGISFYSFQILSYLIDLYRHDCRVQRRLDRFILYESLFPQLIAGPIVRYRDIQDEIAARQSSYQDRVEGARRFVAGLAKKCLVANYAGKLVDQTLGSSHLDQLSAVQCLLGLTAFTLQIYYDFSAYSDMAIGLGRIFGFHFLENFKYPYMSASVTEFWRRWHISLSSFFRDYVYIPLGGKHRFQMRNLLIVWFLTGFWHGASWNFILWGLYFLLFLLLEKYLLLDHLRRLPRLVAWLYMIPVIMGGWAVFYFTDFAALGQFLARLFSFTNNLEGKLLFRQNALFFLFAYLGALPVLPGLKKLLLSWQPFQGRENSPQWAAFSTTLMLLLLFLSTASLVGASYNPFLYFRF